MLARCKKGAAARGTHRYTFFSAAAPVRRFFFGRLDAAMCGDVGALLPGMYQPLAPAANVLCIHSASFSSMHSQLSAPLPSSALPRSTQRHPPSTRSAIHLPLMAFSPRKQISSVNGSRRSSRQSKWTLTPKVAGAGPVPRVGPAVHTLQRCQGPCSAANAQRSAAAALRPQASCALGSLRDTAYGFSILFDPLSIHCAAGRAELRSLRCSSSN